jgi:hypothetical protein
VHAVVEELLTRDLIVLDGIDSDFFTGDTLTRGFGRDIQGKEDDELVRVRAIEKRPGHGLPVEVLVGEPQRANLIYSRPCETATRRSVSMARNGLLLTPRIDHLFDLGFISFQRDGGLIISPVAHRLSLQRMGVPTDEAINVGAFSDRQDWFLEYHRDAVLLRSVR